MNQIPDADYIREAEQKGIPPYRSIDDFDVSQVESEFDRANYYIGRAVDHMCRAARYAEKFDMNGPIDILIDRLGDLFRDDMRKLIEKYKRSEV